MGGRVCQLSPFIVLGAKVGVRSLCHGKYKSLIETSPRCRAGIAFSSCSSRILTGRGGT